jgi:microcystin-dependent protein
MSQPFLGQIGVFSFNFAPKGWTMCNGQLLPINQNQALFALLGTTYGGNGQTTFALPDMRSKVPVHFGQGPGLGSYNLGQTGGEESHTLIIAELGHNHPVNVFNGNGNSRSPVGHIPAIVQGTATNVYSTAAPTSGTNEGWGNAGGSQPHSNIEPYLTLNFCMALQGIFPSQN